MPMPMAMDCCGKVQEEWIRLRLQITRSDIGNVKMLSLPGTEYDHVKIQCMGTSLARFINLRHIDLSLNALTSLRGLETLGQLEKLNIYHNNLTLLSELFRLHHNARLNEVDIRMNPVSLNEKDYRLFLIHLLPDLELLDDSKVWSSERMAAQLYFTKFSVQQPDKGHPVSTVVPPRVRLVQQVLRLTADPKGSIQQLPCSEGCSEQHCSNFKPIHASYSLCRNKDDGASKGKCESGTELSYPNLLKLCSADTPIYQAKAFPRTRALNDSPRLPVIDAEARKDVLNVYRDKIEKLLERRALGCETHGSLQILLTSLQEEIEQLSMSKTSQLLAVVMDEIKILRREVELLASSTTR